ncbi:DNA recomination protein [Yersinia phage vB_Yen_X1]|nr:DNA recomination protein [Yersinia phage vB_Yen_X1]
MGAVLTTNEENRMTNNVQISCLPALAPARDLILSQQGQFEAVVTDDKINFVKEAGFALQILQGNNFTCGVAQRNPESLKNAITNVAAIGVSLNPAKKHAYLVPRNGNVCLDISYLGLINIAVESGSIKWAQAKIVYSNDTYENTGVDTAPIHKYNAFGNRGEIIGAYVTVKTRDDSYLTTEMSIDEIHRIRQRSESFKKGNSSPWKTDYEEMVKKTVIKRAYKLWPVSDRLANAIEMLNEQGEGIDFNSERKASGERVISIANTKQVAEIREALSFIGRQEPQFVQYLSASVFKRDIQSLEDLTDHEATQAINMLKTIADRMAATQPQGDVF